jgi:hypothetical protein
MTVTLAPTRLHWISDDGKDDEADLCAHSPVEFTVNGEQIISPGDGDWAVSTSALYLLRTLLEERRVTDSESDQLFPHCGHMPAVAEDGRVFFIGCQTGVDLSVRHKLADVVLELLDGRVLPVAWVEWRAAVVAFSDSVESFYASGAAKKAEDASDERDFNAFRAEWRRIRERV